MSDIPPESMRLASNPDTGVGMPCNRKQRKRKQQPTGNTSSRILIGPTSVPENANTVNTITNKRRRMKNTLTMDRTNTTICHDNILSANTLTGVPGAPTTAANKPANTKYLSLAPPRYICQSCDAIMWYEERVKKTSNRRQTKFNMCCKEGRIVLEHLKDPPHFLRTLLDYSQGPAARKFRQNIRMYNSAYAFTSMGAKVDKTVTNTPGPFTFRISGQNSHYIGSLLPTGDRTPSFIQLYVYDTSNEIELRAGIFGKKKDCDVLDKDILTGLKQMLDAFNPIARTFRMAQQRLKEDNNVSLSIKLLGTRVQKDRVYSTPAAPEIAALIVGDIGGTGAGRDIIIERKRGGLKRITELHPSFMALQYPLLFPHGQDSFHTDIPYIVDVTKKRIKREYVTMREYYAYRLQQRLLNGYALLRGGKLLHQFIVDRCCAIESQRLWFIRNNQPYLRCEMLNHLCDAVNKGDYVGAEVGTRIILPASFTGSKRYMQQNYQDAMAICRWFGNPHLFITFTANPNWPEINQMLEHIEGQKAEDRPDIIARVFQLKLRQLMDCLKHEHYFGRAVADVYTIEFQKRGLPHAHILLWLKKDDVQLTPQFIDGIIHAEISDPEEDPVLYDIVSRYMVHGPCGEKNPNCPCMLDGKECNKKYPKSYNSETAIDRNGYPVYRRRENGRKIKKGIHELDNRSIVPYNPGLLLMFDAHINVEWCSTARAIKYLFKYILKGPDKATVVISRDEEDEIQSYLDCRYLSTCEGAWRIFEFDIHERSPAVMRLPVHLEGEQAVVLKDKDKLKVVIDRANDTPTMLMGWMTANKEYKEAADLTYAQMPTRFVWKDKAWKLREKGMSIGRMAFVHPTAGERYYLRQLLNLVKGSKSFQDIKTVDGHPYSTYKEACFAKGLLNNDKEWKDALNEANQWAMPSQLRELFVTMLLFCEVTDVLELWKHSQEMLSEDIERKKRRLFNHPGLVLTEEAKITYTLIEIEQILLRYGKNLKDIKGMPVPQIEDVRGLENKLIREERMYDTRQLKEEWSQKEVQLNEEQRAVYDKVIEAVHTESSQVIFLYGHGGTGKTFLYTTISARLRSEGEIVLNVASSGIAALLLPGGRTAHSMFEIPIELFENSTCNISQKSQLAELLRQTSLIIWDEAPMDHRFAFEALDRTMRDLLGLENPEARTKLFGGKVVLLGGDFRQVLPIITKGKRQDIVQASINRSYIWNECQVFTLSRSMRVSETAEDSQMQERNRRFNSWLLAMGDGRIETKAEDNETDPTWIEIPKEYIGNNGKLTVENVVESIYPEFQQERFNERYLKERAILTPLNETADKINTYMASLIQSEEKSYRSCDEVCTSSTEGEEQYTDYPTEYLNSLNLQGLPPHE